ncbi:uncharacterized protein BDV14DRAFT_194440 [Aspergillus stella-maris]|uniref:uncharacterized protein n=1 Tax=Aspergillus stella-maris TaxID=1810926 RepID=UPI003CCCF169
MILILCPRRIKRGLPTKDAVPYVGSTVFNFSKLFGLSSGPWTRWFPVRMLSITAHVKAVMLFLCRDLHYSRRVYFVWYHQLHHLTERDIDPEGAESDDDDGVDDVNSDIDDEVEQEVVKYELGSLPQIQEFWDLLHGHINPDLDQDVFVPC